VNSLLAVHQFAHLALAEMMIDLRCQPNEQCLEAMAHLRLDAPQVRCAIELQLFVDGCKL
jgi:hypothetical protein